MVLKLNGILQILTDRIHFYSPCQLLIRPKIVTSGLDDAGLCGKGYNLDSFRQILYNCHRNFSMKTK